MSYGRANDEHFWAEVHRLVESGAKRFCDVGGGARPVVSLANIQKFGLEYVVLDEAQDRLDKAPSGYRPFRADILDKDAISEFLRQHGPFDVVLSRWTAEHIPNGRLFHEQVFSMLRPGGTAVHFFPTLYAAPFLLNRFIPSKLSATIVFQLWKDRDRQSKFRAYYSWCRGPTRRQIRRLQSVGFSVDRYVGFFGHSFYESIKLLHLAHIGFTNLLLDHPCPSMTTFGLVVLTRPVEASQGDA